jgi:hypothetical protein
MERAMRLELTTYSMANATGTLSKAPDFTDNL